jgi:oligopeptide transport system substrate-binding protein
MYRTLAGLLAVVAAALLLAGLSFSATSSKPADVRILNSVEPETLDPQLLNGVSGRRIVSALFEGLTRSEAQTLEPAPGVAQSWDISDDGLRYTFHLRQDSHWSDGVVLSAHDFTYSWRRLLAPETAARYAYLLHGVRGARALNMFDALARRIETTLLAPLTEQLTNAAGAPLTAEAWRALGRKLPLHDCLQFSQDEGVRALLDGTPEAVPAERLERLIQTLPGEARRLREAAEDARARFGESLGVYATDAQTLVVELEAPIPYFLELTSFYPSFAVPRHVVESFGPTWFLPEHIVSNGPFLLETWRVGDRIRLRKDPAYWGQDEVRAQAIELYPVENVTTALNMYLTHQADWLPTMYPTDLVTELLARPDFYVHPGFNTYYYRFNTLRPPLDDARVREALNLAVDRQLVVEQVIGLGQLSATHFVPPGIPGYEPPESHIRLDVERARRLLAEAGYPDGKGFPTIGMLYNTQDMHKKIAEVVADQLRQRLGIDVRPYNQEWQSQIATVRAGQYDIARASWSGDYVDPNTFLDLWVTNGGNNMTGFSSPLYDALIRAAADMVRFTEHPQRLLGQLKQPARVAELLEQRALSTDAPTRRGLLERARLRLLAEAEAILVQDEFPILPIFFDANKGLRAPGLRGLHTELTRPDGTRSSNLQPVHPLRDMWSEPRRSAGNGEP